MMVSWICGACKVAMHQKTIALCKREKIGTLYCGAHEESAAIFPAQMEAVIDDTKEFYARHDVTYESPVYRMGRTDHKLHEMGITEKRNLKDQHVIYSTQHSCVLGMVLHAHSRLYYHRIHGVDRYQRLAHEIARSKMDELDDAR